MLLRRGHEVVAAARSPEKDPLLRSTGAAFVSMDGLNASMVIRRIAAARPDVVVHLMTALANVTNFKNLDAALALTNRLRGEGTRNMLVGAQAAGVKRFVAQSFTGWPNAREGGRTKVEEDRLDPNPPPSMVRSLEAIRDLEESVLSAPGVTGIVLRYGAFYGPRTSMAPGGFVAEAIRCRKLPIVGRGSGVWSFIHLEDAAEAARLAIEGDTGGIFNVVDDEPAEARIWLPYFAQLLGAKPPHRVPVWVGRLMAGEATVLMMTRQRGASNAKARSLLGWRPSYTTWRDGFRQSLMPTRAA